jgi:hypothetical protein
MFILLEKSKFKWVTPDGLDATPEFETELEAEEFRDEYNLVDAAIFELKGWM